MDKHFLLALTSVVLSANCAAASPPLPVQQTSPNQMEIKSVFGKKLATKSDNITIPKKAPSKAPTVNPTDYANRSFAGALIYTESWMDMSITEIPYGIYDFTIESDGLKRTPNYTVMSGDWMSGAVKRDKFYGIRNINMFGQLTGVVNCEVDLKSYTNLREVIAEEPSFELLPSAMTYDPTSGEIYGVFYNADLTGLNWARYDTRNLEVDIICRFGGKFNVLAIGATPDGTMYAISTDGDLYTINKKNARVSLIGNTGVNVAAYTQTMTWDAKTNTFLWTAVTSSGSALYSLDPEVPKATLIKTLTEGEQFASIYFNEQTAMPGAPKTPENITWNYTTPGALNGNITFTSPSAGEVTVFLNGEKAKDAEKIGAGATVTIQLSNLDNKTNHVAAVIRNDNGWSPIAESFSYAGYDIPKPVTDLTFVEKDGVANISWTAPAGGVEDGFIDPNRLYYQIYRLPENILVADNHRTTSFTEVLPKGVKRYAYRVIPFNGADKQGEHTLSNALVYGTAYEIPYTDSFTMEGCLDVYETIDADGDGQTWNINPYGDVPLLACSVTYADEATATDDWILTPNISLEKGTLYRVTTCMRNTWPGNPDLLAVGFCKSTNLSKDGITVVETLEVNTPSMTRLNHFVDFSVEADGDYKVALGMVTPKGQGGGVFISELRVDKVGSLSAPAAATNLTVTPDADGLSKATITFTAPDKTLGGKALSDPMSAVIYRDDLEVARVNDIAPKAISSWTDDTNPAPGMHIYKVVMHNSSGCGGDVSASAFVGIYTTPFIDPLDTREAIEYYTYIPVGFEDAELDSEMRFPSWGDPCLEVDHVNQSDNHHEFYVVLPLISFDDEAVYKVSFDIKTMSWSSGEPLAMELTYGDTAQASTQTCKGFDIANPTGYDFETQEHLLILPKGGKKYLAFHVNTPTQGYIYLYIRNIRIEREASALSPNVVTELTATNDLVSKLTFKAPAIDYASRPLKELDKVEIYRNGSVLPVHTFTNPAPGELLEWTDPDALQGMNSYFIVASNSHGRGNPTTVSAFIGYDIPVAPEGLSIIPNPGNQTATITWQAPTRGVNGGVVNLEETTYTLVRMIPATESNASPEFDVLKTGIKETSVTPEREATDKQEMIYYGILTVTPQGISHPSIYFTILGKPYPMPFTESFGNGDISTGLWVSLGDPNYGLQTLPTSSDMLEYNGYPAVSQDNDNGVFLFLNGAYQENPMLYGVLTPKIDLGNVADPQVSFWLYKGNQSGYCNTPPSFEILASTTESDFRLLGGTEWTETSPAWVEYTYPLDCFVGDPGALIFQLNATSGIYADIILMDNFRVESSTAIDQVGADTTDCTVFGLSGGILTRGAVGCDVRIYTPAGLLIDSYKADDSMHPRTSGIYIVTIGSKTFKVVVK